ncbi:hypothetical protein ACI2K4_23040 [Micromonospora sp. NPDC050397]|uniref:hypothetical protein n=1 Tax=Micromonospora sp. NPDC050397 TaxID=3364279 RepID=UPI00384CECEC
MRTTRILAAGAAGLALVLGTATAAMAEDTIVTLTVTAEDGLAVDVTHSVL